MDRNECHDLLIWSYFVVENRLRINTLMRRVFPMFPFSMYEKMNLATWDENEMAGLKEKSGPPGNMNAFKHGLAAIQ